MNVPRQPDDFTTEPPLVRIHYLRQPDRLTVFEQYILFERDDVIVTFLPKSDVKRSIVVDGRTILEQDAPIVWFTFPGAWHDIGRFHTNAGEFTGWYANILSPVQFASRREWHTRDLCLDVWRAADGTLRLLDEDEFAEASAKGWITPEEQRRARQEAAAILEAARRDEWPPPIAREWTLERAKQIFCDTGNARFRAV